MDPPHLSSICSKTLQNPRDPSWPKACAPAIGLGTLEEGRAAVGASMRGRVGEEP